MECLKFSNSKVFTTLLHITFFILHYFYIPKPLITEFKNKMNNSSSNHQVFLLNVS